jgi:hypothetical protein
MLLLEVVFVPETYAPVLLRKSVETLSLMSGKVWPAASTALVDPWVLLFKGPIICVLLIYMAIIYRTLFMILVPFLYAFRRSVARTKALVASLSSV